MRQIVEEKVADGFRNLLRFVHLRKMSAIGEGDQAVVRKPLVQPVRVVDRQPAVVFAPEDEDRLLNSGEERIDLPHRLGRDPLEKSEEIFPPAQSCEGGDHPLDQYVGEEMGIMKRARKEGPGAAFQDRLIQEIGKEGAEDPAPGDFRGDRGSGEAIGID